jgi:2-dehydro-3-deoxy-D-arabinonate dehydratase
LKRTIPISPFEVWACGCSYKVSAEWRDAEHGAREGFYAAVYKNKRPELFFKGTSRVCTGPGEYIGIRTDSNFTAPEPELAVVVGSSGKVFGYTIGNDVSAWDIERENPLYLPQSKVFNGCVALGPVIVTVDEIKDPYNLNISCTIYREGKTIFEGESTTQRLDRKIEDMIDSLLISNKIPSGTVLMTGTGIIIQAENALKPGDVVKISIPEIGELTNIAEIV